MVQDAREKIAVAIPRMPDADMVLPNLRRIDGARYYSNLGLLVQEFEARIAAGFGVVPASVTTVASGTAALILALRASNPLPGDLCMMPSWTFSATAHAAREAGLTPFFVDVAPDNWALTPEFAAAVGLAALDAWPFVRTGYVRLAQNYAAALSAVPGLSVMSGIGQGWAGTTCNVELSRPATGSVARALARAGIESRHWWGRGCHQQAAFSYFPGASLAVTRRLANHTLALPFHLNLGPGELNSIVTTVAQGLTESAEAAAAPPPDRQRVAQAG